MKNLLLSIVGGFALLGCVDVFYTNESVQQETDSNWDLHSTWAAKDVSGANHVRYSKGGAGQG